MKTKTNNRQSTKINYPIGDFLVRLKNAVIAGNKEVQVPATKLIKSVAQVLKKEGFLDNIVSSDESITVSLSVRKKEHVLMDVKLVSKPGLRVYMKIDELKKVRGPFVMLLSSPHGILTAKEAVKKGTGGEVIAKIY